MVPVAALASLGARGAVLWARGSHRRDVMHKEFLGLAWCQTLLLTLPEPVCVWGLPGEAGGSLPFGLLPVGLLLARVRSVLLSH